jgi:uncharacterized protein
MKNLAMMAIRAYQKYLSPHKGFCCAHKFNEKKQSCSTIGYRAISRFGLSGGMSILSKKLKKCKLSAQKNSKKANEVKNIEQYPGRYMRYKTQAGFLDGCDCGDVGGCVEIKDCDLPNPCDCSMPNGWFGRATDAVETTSDLASDVLDSTKRNRTIKSRAQKSSKKEKESVLKS